jgi:MFS family permease
LKIPRFLIGIGSGLGLCVGPIYLAEIAPSSISGTVGSSLFITYTGQLFNRGHLGVLTQLAIVLGIMLTQVAGITLAAPSTWRFVFFISFMISALQFLLGSMIVESPTWLFNQSRLEDRKHAVRRLWGDTDSEEPLLNQLEETLEVSPQESLTVPQVYTTIGLRKPLMIVALAMISQQLSGK